MVNAEDIEPSVDTDCEGTEKCELARRMVTRMKLEERGHVDLVR